MSATGASTVEQRALRISIWASIGFAVISAVWGLMAGSEVILVNAIFTPLELLISWGSLIVSRIVAKGPSNMFPFGRNALAPLYVIGQTIIFFGAIAYVIFEAVRVILEGGSEVAGASLVAYGVFSGLICVIMWRIVLRMTHDRPLVEAEAAGWLSSVPSSATIAGGGVVVLLLNGTRYAAVAPYVDPALVIISSVVFLAIPVSLVRRSVRDLQSARPDPDIMTHVETLVEDIREAERLPEPILRIGRLGTVLDIELAFVVPRGTGEVACQDRMRRALRDGCRELPYDVWFTVEFSHDAELIENRAAS